MKKTRFKETQIVSILHQQEAGKSVKDICREHGISDARFYNWKAKYGGMGVSDVRRMKDLESRSFFQPDLFHESNIARFIAQALQTWFHLQVSY